MNQLTGTNKDAVVLQIRSLTVYAFLNRYNELEKLVRKGFEKEIAQYSPKFINKLYFYLGANNVAFIDVDREAIRCEDYKYNEEETFNRLRINQIVKILAKTSCDSAFKTSIDSIQRSTIAFPITDCVLKFVNMRNILAHEIENCLFKDKDYVEILSDDYLTQYAVPELEGYSPEQMDNITKQIISNTIYMDRTIQKLQDLLCDTGSL